MYRLAITLLLSLTISFLSTNNVNALYDPDNPVQDGEVRIMQQNRQGKQVEDEKREQIQERRMNIAHNHAKRLQSRFSFYNTRLNRIKEKLENRMEIIEGKGVDVSQVKAQMANVTAALEEAEEKGSESIDKFYQVNPDQFETQRQIALEGRDLAMDARKSYIEAIEGMKQIVVFLKESIASETGE